MLCDASAADNGNEGASSVMRHHLHRPERIPDGTGHGGGGAPALAPPSCQAVPPYDDESSTRTAALAHPHANRSPLLVGAALVAVLGLAASTMALGEETVSSGAGDAVMAFRTDRAPVPLVLDSIGAVLELEVVVDALPVALVSGPIQGTLADALTELQAIEPLVFDVHEGVLHVLPASASISERLDNDVSATLPMSSVLSLGSSLPANRIESDVSGTRVSGHPMFVNRTVQGLRALLAMRGLAVADPDDRGDSAAASLSSVDDPLSGLEAIPGFNTL